MRDEECPGQGDHAEQVGLVEARLPQEAGEDFEAAVAEELEEILLVGVGTEEDVEVAVVEEREGIEIPSGGVPADAEAPSASGGMPAVEEIGDSDCDEPTPPSSLATVPDPALPEFPGEPMVLPSNKHPFRQSATESSLGKGCSLSILEVDDDEETATFTKQGSAESVEQMMKKMDLACEASPKPEAGFLVRVCASPFACSRRFATGC